MNSIKIEVVEIDAAGNGLGIAHIKGFNNAKLGVEFKGIKVKEGGCIYAGQAITNSVDLALLNQKQRAALAQAYAIYNKALDKIEENAAGVAETINGFLDGLQKAKEKAQALSSKIAAGQTPTEAEVKTLAKLEDQNLKTMTAAIDQLKKKYKDDINTEALALMEGYMADKRAAATALASYKPSMGPPPAAILQATANSQPEVIEKTMKSVGPLMIAYNGKEYPIKKEKTINVVTSKNSVTIKNLTEGDAYSWTLSDGTAGSTNPIAITFPDGKNELTLEVTQGNRKTNVTLKKMPDFNLNNLVLKDAKHKSRVAKVGETLYLVGHGDIEAVATGDAPAYTKTFTHPDLSWSVITEGQSDPQALYAGKSTYQRNFGANPAGIDIRRKTIEARDVDGGDKNISVTIVDEDRTSHSYTPLKLKNAIDYVKDAGSFISLLSGCTFVKDVNFNGKVSIANYNEEDKKNGVYYYKIKEEGWKIGLDGKLISCEFMLPGVSPQLTKWLPDNYKPFFIELSAGGEYSSATYNKIRNDNYKALESKNIGKINLKLVGGIKLGAEIKNKELNSEVKLTGKAVIQGGMDIVFDKKLCPSDGLGFKLLRSPIVFKTSLELEAKVVTLGFSVGPYEYERQLIGKGNESPYCIDLKQ